MLPGYSKWAREIRNRPDGNQTTTLNENSDAAGLIRMRDFRMQPAATRNPQPFLKLTENSDSAGLTTI